MILSERLDALNRKFLAMQFSLDRQLDFLNGIFLLIGDGIAPRDALRLSMSAGNPIDNVVARSMLGKLREGLPISSGMHGMFRHDVAAAVAAAEQSDDFSTAGQQVVEHLREQAQTRKGVIGKLLRPAAYLGLAVGLYAMFAVMIWPRFETLAALDSWHPLARANYAFGLFFVNYWYLVLASLALLALGLRYLLVNWSGPMRWHFDRLWPMNLYREVMAANALESLGTLLVAGHDFRTALATVNRYASPYAKLYLRKVQLRLRDGRNIPRALDVGLLTDADMSRLRLLAEFKGLRGAMVRMGETARKAVMARLTAMATLLGGIALTVVAVSYAGLVISMYLNASSLQSQVTNTL